MKNIFLKLLISFFAFTNPANAKIVKWVDSNGVTHYGDKLPSQEAGRDNSVLSNQGIVVKKNDPISNKTETDKQLLEQNRRDNALLGSYNSEEEIELSRNRNTKTDETAIEALKNRIASFNLMLNKNKQTSATLLKQNKKIPEVLAQDTAYNQAEIKKMVAQIAVREKSINETRLRFDADKKRYAELKPRTQSLTDIKFKKKNLSELESWRDQAQAKLAKYREEAVYYKRATTQTPPDLVARIQQATDELARSEEEISAAKSAIKNKEQIFSK